LNRCAKRLSLILTGNYRIFDSGERLSYRGGQFFLEFSLILLEKTIEYFLLLTVKNKVDFEVIVMIP